MPFTAIRDRIITALEAVGSVGNVLNRERRPEDLDPSVFKVTFRPTGELDGPINAWEVYRTSVIEEVPTDGEQANAIHAFTLEGWYSFDDDVGGGEGSDATFQAIVDDVRSAMRFVGDLSGDAFRVRAVQTQSIDLAVLGEYLCHHAVVGIEVEERILGSNTSMAVPAAPAAGTHDDIMTELSTILSAAPMSADAVTIGRNFPLLRSQRHALLVPLAVNEIERASDQVLERWTVLVRLSYDVADTAGTGDDAVGEDAARHVREWIDGLQSSWHRKTATDFAAITGLVVTEVVERDRPIERLDVPWTARVEATVECSASAWRSTA